MVLVLVGMGYAFGLVVHVQQKCESRNWRIEKMAKHLLKELKDLWVWSFLRTAMQFFWFTSYCSFFHTHQACHGLHRVLAVFSLCLCLRLRFQASNLLTMRPLQCWEGKCTQFCVNRVFADLGQTQKALAQKQWPYMQEETDEDHRCTCWWWENPECQVSLTLHHKEKTEHWHQWHCSVR